MLCFSLPVDVTWKTLRVHVFEEQHVLMQQM